MRKVTRLKIRYRKEICLKTDFVLRRSERIIAIFVYTQGDPYTTATKFKINTPSR